ncbi:E3 ubiquitin-protein ligase, putative (DUF1644) [Wolffia australiana]
MSRLNSHKRPLPMLSSMDSGPNTVANLEDVVCPICLDFPHNGVLLQCSSFSKGCRPFICDTGETHSNCLNRFKTANGMVTSKESQDCKPKCPLCRGDVTGSVVIEEARAHLNSKRRCCEERHCSFVGDYVSLQEHAQTVHPHSRPSEIDPARKMDWEQFQQSSEIIDVITTIHSEMPRGVVLGDYVIEYGDDDGDEDEYEDFPGDDGHWWTSCILYQVFDNFRSSRNRRRSRRGNHRTGFDQSTEDGSSSSPDTVDLRLDEADEEFSSTNAIPVQSRAAASHSSSRRRRSRFND